MIGCFFKILSNSSTSTTKSFWFNLSPKKINSINFTSFVYKIHVANGQYQGLSATALNNGKDDKLTFSRTFSRSDLLEDSLLPRLRTCQDGEKLIASVSHRVSLKCGPNKA